MLLLGHSLLLLLEAGYWVNELLLDAARQFLHYIQPPEHRTAHFPIAEGISAWFRLRQQQVLCSRSAEHSVQVNSLPELCRGTVLFWHLTPSLHVFFWKQKVIFRFKNRYIPPCKTRLNLALIACCAFLGFQEKKKKAIQDWPKWAGGGEEPTNPKQTTQTRKTHHISSFPLHNISVAGTPGSFCACFYLSCIDW